MIEQANIVFTSSDYFVNTMPASTTAVRVQRHAKGKQLASANPAERSNGLWNTEQPWGVYKEVWIDPETIQRDVQVWEGGRTAVHRHEVANTLTVKSGRIKVEVGSDPDALDAHILEPGDSFTVESGQWQAMECLTKASVIKPYAEVLEDVHGANNFGRYEITQHAPAIESPALTKAKLRGDFQPVSLEFNGLGIS